VARGGLANQDEVDPDLLEALPGVVQLDHVRAAERSAVVAEPDERGRLHAPEVAEANGLAVVVGQDDVLEHGTIVLSAG
jgi:hypothetical protein